MKTPEDITEKFRNGIEKISGCMSDIDPEASQGCFEKAYTGLLSDIREYGLKMFKSGRDYENLPIK